MHTTVPNSTINHESCLVIEKKKAERREDERIKMTIENMNWVAEIFAFSTFIAT